MIRASQTHRIRRSAAVLAAVIACAAAPAAHSADSTRLALQLIDYQAYDDEMELQIIAINGELKQLATRLPGVEVVTDLWPEGDFEYWLSFQSVKSEADSLSLEARFRGPDFEIDIPPQYRDPCTEFHRRAQIPCDPATLEQRAAGVVADLFDLTINDRSRGLYRPFDVMDCNRQGDRVRMQVVSRSIVEAYKVPHIWFRYRPGIVAGAAPVGDPDPVPVLLSRRTTDRDGYVVFVCESGSIKDLDPYCETDEAAVAAAGEISAAGLGAGTDDGPRIVLEHRYPGRHLLPPPVLPPPVGVNQSPALSAELR